MSEVLVERDGPVATLVLNRPDRLNAISVSMLDALSEALLACDRELLPLFGSRDFREGMRAFLEKRTPDFEGR